MLQLRWCLQTPVVKALTPLLGQHGVGPLNLAQPAVQRNPVSKQPFRQHLPGFCLLPEG